MDGVSSSQGGWALSAPQDSKSTAAQAGQTLRWMLVEV